ncbi:hypothetical protein FCG67_09870 [Rhodococcus oryzae]|uniref:Uncharacterized protein n=2 Tax=Rhodococcus oryzae TaxID=2571143 RepID=A0ABY2RKQ9_9NOCA|nr:hypothetical protein FCG67_09870 [Rhodococcus oryzae]
MNGNTFRRLATTAAVSAGIAGGLVAGAGSAAAAETQVVPMSTCFGLSPYIVDQPYIASRAFFNQDGPGTGNLTLADVSSLWFFAPPYLSDTRLDWHNKTTGARGTLTATTPIGMGSAVYLRLNSGPGDVEITRSAVNRNALWSIPTTSCTGTVRVN